MSRIGGNPGNKGGGRRKLNQEFDLIRAIDKYAPEFWSVIDKWLKSDDKDKQKFALSEFNKLQIKRVPQNIDLTSNGKTLSKLCEAIEEMN